MLRIAIVEDEPASAEKLQSFAQRYAAEHADNFQITCFSNGLQFLEPYKACYDVVFLDIIMPYMNGTELAHRLRELDDSVLIVFVTSMAQYAIAGYEVGALDFMLKPVEYDEFSVKMARICRYCQKHTPAAISISQKETIVLLRVRDIAHVEVYNHSLVFHTADKSFETHGQLSQLEEDPRFSGFVKCSTSHLINCAFVSEIGPDYFLVADRQIPVSRRRRKDCLEKMALILGGGYR